MQANEHEADYIAAWRYYAGHWWWDAWLLMWGWIGYDVLQRVRPHVQAGVTVRQREEIAALKAERDKLAESTIRGAIALRGIAETRPDGLNTNGLVRLVRALSSLASLGLKVMGTEPPARQVNAPASDRDIKPENMP